MPGDEHHAIEMIGATGHPETRARQNGAHTGIRGAEIKIKKRRTTTNDQENRSGSTDEEDRGHLRMMASLKTGKDVSNAIEKLWRTTSQETSRLQLGEVVLSLHRPIPSPSRLERSPRSPKKSQTLVPRVTSQRLPTRLSKQTGPRSRSSIMNRQKRASPRHAINGSYLYSKATTSWTQSTSVIGAVGLWDESLQLSTCWPSTRPSASNTLSFSSGT